MRRNFGIIIYSVVVVGIAAKLGLYKDLDLTDNIAQTVFMNVGLAAVAVELWHLFPYALFHLKKITQRRKNANSDRDDKSM